MSKPIDKQKILFLDGAMGTMLQKSGMPAGKKPEELNIESPKLLESIHRQYLEAGAHIVYANTFGASPLKMKESSVPFDKAIEAAVKNAKKAAVPFGGLVALDIGPLGELLEPMGSLSFEEAYDNFAAIVKAGADAGADLIVIETMSDLYEAKAALLAAKENSDLEVWVTMSFEADGRTFTGCTIESMAMTLEGLGADVIGLNCSAGPDQMAPLLKRLVQCTSLPVAAKPNAGLPDPVTGAYDMDPGQFAASLKECLDAGVSIIGGCCGTTPEFISQIHQEYKDHPVQKHPGRIAGVCSPSHATLMDSVRVIGERINPTGKKRFQQALLEEDLDYIVSVGLSQQEAGADILDVNVGFPGVDEADMLPKVVKALQAAVDIPLQLDSSDPSALEKALRIYNGKPSINSVNGTLKSRRAILPLAAKYGAAVVGLTIDEQGIPSDAARRVSIAALLKESCKEYGIPSGDLWIDPLSLTVSAQQSQASASLQALEQITRELELATVLGVSNISFGLPNRPLLNQTFLVQALQAGLKLPIMNPNQKEMMDALAAFKTLSGQDPQCQAYVERFANQAGAPAKTAASQSPHTLQEAIEKGLKSEASKIAAELLKTQKELDLVENDLIPALDLVGQEYESGKAFLPQLLSAAGAAQAVFEVLKTSLAQKGESKISKGTIVMATVQGDIHDIGKNIVKTVLENYGYTILDLGKDVAPEKIVEAVEENQIRLVGLSALMTTTLPSMEKTVRMLRALKNPPKIMVGGAVVTPQYAKDIEADYYSKDANQGVAIAREVFGS